MCWWFQRKNCNIQLYHVYMIRVVSECTYITRPTQRTPEVDPMLVSCLTSAQDGFKNKQFFVEMSRGLLGFYHLSKQTLTISTTPTHQTIHQSNHPHTQPSNHSSTHPTIHSSDHSPIRSPSHSPILLAIHTSIHAFTYPSIPPSKPSNHPPIHAPDHPPIRSSTHWTIYSFNHSLIQSSTHPTQSSTHPIIHLFDHPLLSIQLSNDSNYFS